MPDSLTMTRLAVDAPFSLWVVDLQIEPAGSEVAKLDPVERTRHDRFHFACDRRRYRVAHIALRTLLADASGIAISKQRFAFGNFGKPALVGRPALAFSLSYAGDAALIGIGQGRAIGVDVESRRTVDGLEDIAQRVFVASEHDSLMALPAGPARHAAFLHGWTRKEACVKALGTGLSASLEFAAGIAAEQSKTVFAEDGCAAILVGSFIFGDALICAWAQRL